jgi:hypothetical protein
LDWRGHITIAAVVGSSEHSRLMNFRLQKRKYGNFLGKLSRSYVSVGLLDNNTAAALKKEAACSSRTLISTHKSTQFYYSEDKL